MENRKSKELEDRFVKFGVEVIQLTQRLKQQIPYTVASQVIRSATSIGANYAEAQNASSRADFRNKIYIAKKEASETRYWLRTIGELVPEDLPKNILQESQELLLILQKITNTLRAKPAKATT